MIHGVYLVLDPDATHGRSASEVAAAALRGGISIVQWRQKGGSIAARWPELLIVRELCQRHGIPFLVNDRVDIALAVDAEGAHIGQDDLPVEVARRLLKDRLLGVSISTLAELIAAKEAGADYVGIGPIFPTLSKPNAGPAIGLEGLRKAREATTMPLVAIGGITKENAAHVKAAGADAIAVISAICGAADVEVATRELRLVIEGTTVL